MHLNYNVIVMYYLRDMCVVFLSLHLDLLSNLHMWKMLIIMIISNIQ